jgi:hypothetical protein
MNEIDAQELKPALPPVPVQVLIVPLIVIVTMIGYSITQSPDAINYDCAFYLLCSKLLLEGKQPFEHFVDLLPPVIFYLSVPPWWISQVTSLPITLVWQLLVLSFIVCSGIVSIFLIRAARSCQPRDWLLLGPLFCSYLLFHFVIGFHFGQREHLFVLAYFPMFILRWLRWNDAVASPSPGSTEPGSTETASHGTSAPILKFIPTVIGVACGVTAFVKPQFLLIPILVELALLLSSVINPGSRSHRPQWRDLFLRGELYATAITLFACFCAMFLIPNVQEYFLRWVPFLLKGYSAYNSPSLSDVLTFTSPDGHMLGDRFLALGVCVLALLLCRRSTLSLPLLAWTLAGLIIFIAQGRGWSYQSIPFVWGYFMVAGLSIAMVCEYVLSKIGMLRASLRFLNFQSWKKTISENAQPLTIVASTTALFVFFLWGVSLFPLSTLLVKNSMVTGRTFDTLDGLLESETKPDDPVVILHTTFPHAHQVQLRKRRWPGSRYIWCFPMRMSYYLKDRAESRDLALAEEQKVVAEIVSDIRKSKPKLIVIEAWPTGRDGWTLYEGLERYRFTEKALADYVPSGWYNNCAVWKLKESLRRNPS